MVTKAQARIALITDPGLLFFGSLQTRFNPCRQPMLALEVHGLSGVEQKRLFEENQAEIARNLRRRLPC